LSSCSRRLGHVAPFAPPLEVILGSRRPEKVQVRSVPSFQRRRALGGGARRQEGASRSSQRCEGACNAGRTGLEVGSCRESRSRREAGDCEGHGSERHRCEGHRCEGHRCEERSPEERGLETARSQERRFERARTEACRDRPVGSRACARETQRTGETRRRARGRSRGFDARSRTACHASRTAGCRRRRARGQACSREARRACAGCGRSVCTRPRRRRPERGAPCS